MRTALLILDALLFVWFLVTIVRLERYPGRAWHHAYIGVLLVLAVLFAPVLVVHAVLLVTMAAGLLIARPTAYDSKKERAHWSTILTMIALLIVSIVAPYPWVEIALLVVAAYLIGDDALQHTYHLRQRNAGLDPSQWTVSWLHRRYERVYREIFA